jgi:DNA-binding beta-propeller fold protein YncE
MNPILQSNKVLDVTNYKSKISDYINIPSGDQTDAQELKTNVRLDHLVRISFGDFEAALMQVKTSLLSTAFPHLSKRIVMNPVLIFGSTATAVMPLFRIAITGTNEIWASGVRDKIILHYDIKGIKVDTVTTTCPDQPDDIAVTRDGDLVYTDHYNRAVIMVKYGKITTLFSTPWRWHPRGICCTKTGGFLVSVLHVNQKRCKILRYEENSLKQEIETDNQGSQIFTEGNSMILLTESNNGDICCSDPNARAIIVMDRYGHVRAKYDDQAALRKNPFDPGVIVTDSAHLILVADGNNDSIHILNEDAKFLIYISNIGSGPGALCVDTQERLWVGLQDEGKAKVIQYLKSA